MKVCVKVNRLLSRYIDNEINNADKVFVDAHLEICQSCKKALTQVSEVKKLILKKERKALPEDYMVNKVRQDILNEKSALTKGLNWLYDMGDFSRRLIPIPVTAIIVSLIFLFLSFGQQTNGYSLEEQMLEGVQTTTSTALELILGA